MQYEIKKSRDTDTEKYTKNTNVKRDTVLCVWVVILWRWWKSYDMNQSINIETAKHLKCLLILLGKCSKNI